MLNLYKAGVIDAFLNHTVLSSWVDEIKQYKGEYLNFPEMATAYYAINTTKPPFDDLKVRQAFSMSIDRDALSNFRKVTKPLYFQTPTGIFPDYDKTMDGIGEELRKQRNLSPEEWTRSKKQFDPEHARKLLTDAGFPVQQSGNSFSCPAFPADRMALNYNTNDMNRLIAEFIQAQWKQNLGVVIPLKSMESKTFQPMRNAMQYEGFALLLWSGDYMDSYTFLNLYYGQKNESGTGFYDPNFDRLLDEANVELDPQKRYEKLARAEYALAAQLPAIPLSVNSTNWMKKPYIKGLYPNPGTLHAWKFVYIERDPAKWDADVENIMTDQDEQVERQLRELQSGQNQGAAK
jgi:oligopeptide transport system substrate-binding protein